MFERLVDAAVDLMRAVFAVGQADEPLEDDVQRAVLRHDEILIPDGVGRQIRAVAVDDGVDVRPSLIDGLMQEVFARAAAASANLLAGGVHHGDIIRLQEQLHTAGGRDIGQTGLTVDDRGVALQTGDKTLLLQNIGELRQMLCVVHGSTP